MQSTVFQTEGVARLDICAEAFMNRAFLRVISTGTYQQVVVMAVPAYEEIGDEVHVETDQLFVVVDGVGEARVGDYHLAVQTGDMVFVPAGTPHNMINRATVPLRLISLVSPPAYAPGTVVKTNPPREPDTAAPWRPFP